MVTRIKRRKSGHRWISGVGPVPSVPATELTRLAYVPHFEGDRVHNPVLETSSWPIDRESEIVLFEAMQGIVDIGMVGHIYPVVLMSRLPNGGRGTFSIIKSVSTSGISIRLKILNASNLSHRRFWFIDENGTETYAKGLVSAKSAYQDIYERTALNPRNSAKSGDLVVRDEPDLESPGFASAVASLANAGIRGLVSLEEDVNHREWPDYHRAHTTVAVEDGSGRTAWFREDHLDKQVVRRFVIHGSNRTWWDDNDPQILSGFSSEREIIRTLFFSKIAECSSDCDLERSTEQ